MFIHLTKAKHWQIFFILFVIPCSIHFLSFRFLVGSPPFLNRQMLDYHITYISPFVVLYFLSSLMLWFRTVGILLQRSIPIELRLNIKRFQFFIFIPIVYGLYLEGVLFQLTGISFFAPSFEHHPIKIFLYILPFHLCALYGILHTIFFVAKTIKTAELQRQVYFKECIITFFLLYFLPIGIWFIQPKINRIIHILPSSSQAINHNLLLLDDDNFEV